MIILMFAALGNKPLKNKVRHSTRLIDRFYASNYFQIKLQVQMRGTKFGK